MVRRHGTLDFPPRNTQMSCFSNSANSISFKITFCMNIVRQYRNFLHSPHRALPGLYSVGQPLVKFSIDICRDLIQAPRVPTLLPQIVHMPGSDIHVRPSSKSVRISVSSCALSENIRTTCIRTAKNQKAFCRKSWVDFKGLRPRKQTTRVQDLPSPPQKWHGKFF
jgi:hypothetical protein